MVIWKYDVSHQFDVDLPGDAKVVDVQVQGKEPVMWVLLNPELPKNRRRFFAVATGESFDSTNASYIATFQLGMFVFHLFELSL
jgi:hypothetical protein